MLKLQNVTNSDIAKLIKRGQKLPFATESYPSRGQTAVQELYQTEIGKLFLKRVSERNHEECRIDVESGTLAERECWAYLLAEKIGLKVPRLWLMDEATTIQVWLDLPDGKTFKKSTGRMDLLAENIFDCAVFDWVTGQIDRHDANYLYDYIGRTIIPVDSAHGFLKYEGALPDYLHLFEIGEARHLNRKISSKARDVLAGLSDVKLGRIVPLGNAGEMEALKRRRDFIRKAACLKDVLDLFRGRK